VRRKEFFPRIIYFIRREISISHCLSSLLGTVLPLAIFPAFVPPPGLPVVLVSLAFLSSKNRAGSNVAHAHVDAFHACPQSPESSLGLTVRASRSRSSSAAGHGRPQGNPPRCVHPHPLGKNAKLWMFLELAVDLPAQSASETDPHSIQVDCNLEGICVAPTYELSP
jgi:hypothetical protein